MKTLLVILLLVLGLGVVAGCGPKDERSARRIERRNRTIRRDVDALRDDWEIFWLTDEPMHLGRYEGP